MTWQKCPVCHGAGQIPEMNFTVITRVVCRVCAGRGIVDEITGLPPKIPAHPKKK